MPQTGPTLTVRVTGIAIYGHPSVTQVNVTPAVVRIAPGADDTITWNREQNADWTFAGIGQDSAGHPALPNPPFKAPTVSDTSIVVEDDNSAVADTTYNYAIQVRLANGTTVWSDPQIINRGG
jgi:hypothetical protein